MGKTAWYIWAVELLAKNYKRGKREGAADMFASQIDKQMLSPEYIWSSLSGRLMELKICTM